jgi:uncharacterized protein YjbJ (UPF0337 family)
MTSRAQARRQINGNREQLEGKLQAHYGYAKDKAKTEIDNWCSRM